MCGCVDVWMCGCVYIVCLGLLGSRRIALTYWLAGVFPGLLIWHVVRASVACHARCVIVVHSHGTAVAGDFGAATIATRYLDGNQPFARAKPLGPPVLGAVDDIFPLSAASIGTPFPYNPRYYVMGHDRCILCVLVLSASASPGESPLASPAHYAGRAGDSSPTSAAAAMAMLQQRRPPSFNVDGDGSGEVKLEGEVVPDTAPPPQHSSC